MRRLSKSHILAHRQCPRRLWLQIHQPESAGENTSDTSRIATGHQVGEVARSLYPDGALITASSTKQALDETASRLRAPTRPLFEATFQAHHVLIRADLLFPEGRNQWRMAEVKSSSSIKDHHLEDAAIQGCVARSAGLCLSRIDIAHIDTSFIYEGNNDYRGLFTFADITDRLRDLESEVPSWIASAKTTVSGSDPVTDLGEQCHTPYPCPFYDHCTARSGETTGYPPEILPHAKKLAAELRGEGYADIRNIPKGRLTKPQHILIWQASKRNRPILQAEARDELAGLGWPRYYLDFETIQFAVPIWAGTRPYAQIPFQWSCHIESVSGKITHQEYLSDDSRDPSRRFAESLIATLRSKGPVFVYHASFENSRMRELADRYPDLAESLHAIIERVVDLLPIARKHYYHPKMLGSWSIKALLPAISPELAYDDLVVKNGAMAQEGFSEMMQADISEDARSTMRESLLRYCERDTQALVRIAHHFQGKPDAKRQHA